MWPISKCKSQKFMTHKLKITTNPYFLHLMLCTFQHLCQKEAMWTMFWRPRQKRTFITFLWSWHSGSKCANKFVCYSADNKKMEKYLLNRKNYILWLSGWSKFLSSKAHRIWPKVAQKGAQKNFLKKSHIFGKRRTIFDPPNNFYCIFIHEFFGDAKFEKKI